MGAPHGKAYMGWWGHMGSLPQKGIVQYALSPFEQRAFAGAMHNAIFNTARRVSSQIFYIGFPLVLLYSTYSWAKNRNEYLNSKAGHAEAGEH